MSVELTKDARRVLKDVYRLYLERKKAGEPKQSAVKFKNLSIDGIADALPELESAGFVKRDILGNIRLTDKAIIFFENLTKDSVLKWVEIGSNFIP